MTLSQILLRYLGYIKHGVSAGPRELPVALDADYDGL